MALSELSARQSAMWQSGPYERIADTIRDVHALVVERVDAQPGEKLLDAATGTGAVALLAAERGADVVWMDFAPALIDVARELAAEARPQHPVRSRRRRGSVVRRRQLRRRHSRSRRGRPVTSAPCPTS
jgi:predicted RNA methylase